MSNKMPWSEFYRKFSEKGTDSISLTSNTEKMFNGSHSEIELECKKHGLFTTEARRYLTSMFGCGKCAREYKNSLYRKTTSEFIEESRNIFGDRFEYEKTHYVNTKTPITITCKEHGDFTLLPRDHINKKESCPICNISKLELELKNELDKMGILYVRNKKFDWLGKLSIDFYIPSLKLGIECQGKQHFGYGGWSENFDFKAQFYRDSTKYQLCKDNGLELIYLSDKAYNISDSICEIYNNGNLYYDIKDLLKDKIYKK